MRTLGGGGWSRLAADFSWEGSGNPFTEKTIWFAVKSENADFFSTRVYDPFLLVPYYVAMRYGQDLRICGKVSARLYHNLTNYISRIYMDFSDSLQPVRLIVDGFDEAEREGDLVGAGISCGVDSLSTLYDHFVNEAVPGYRISALFLFNAGTHGFFSDPNARVLFEARYRSNKRAADELGLPIYAVESNIHFFAEEVGQNRLGYLANWSCAISLQKRVRRYYAASSLSYGEIIDYHSQYHDRDIDDFCGPFLVPLIQTESLELIYDGAQHRRTQKTEEIADWEIAQKHLNVCLTEKETSENCSCCSKCLRTLAALDAIDHLEEFSGVFDIEKYKKRRFSFLCTMQLEQKASSHYKDGIDFAREHGVRLPPKWVAFLRVRPVGLVKRVLVRIFGEERCVAWKRALIRE